MLDEDEAIYPAKKYEQFKKAALDAMLHDKGNDIAFAGNAILAASAMCQGNQNDFKSALSSAKAAADASSPSDFNQLTTDLKLTQCGKKYFKKM